jgi:DNA polymerase-4
MDRDPPPHGEPAPATEAPAVRKIIHVDMDAFYASVEQRDDPALRGRPVAVGGSSARGVVAAASYEARRFGVRSAMASVTARRRCPELLFVKPRFDVYSAVSRQIHAIFARYTDVIEPLSLDEAYLDVTGAASARDIAQAVRAAIREETGSPRRPASPTTSSWPRSRRTTTSPTGSASSRPRPGRALPPPFRSRASTASGRSPRGGWRGSASTAAPTSSPARSTGCANASARPPTIMSAPPPGIDDAPVRAHRQRKSVGAERTFSADIIDGSRSAGRARPGDRRRLGRIARCNAAGAHRARSRSNMTTSARSRAPTPPPAASPTAMPSPRPARRCSARSCPSPAACGCWG